MRTVVGTRVHDEVVRILDEAKQYAVLISPFLGVWDELERALARCALRGVPVRAIVREPRRGTQEVEVERLRDMGVRVQHCVPRMHLKAYLNEDTAMHTSANLTASAVGKATESALLFDRKTEPDGWAHVCDIWHRVLDDVAR